ncbi:TPA: tyrosine-type recombinase/integrase [Klebsiella pneumoniae]|uniref:site-specific integrase n=1 Tax=Klebsiella pneumoniae TaxID=573 RepID=UPI0020274DFF|nr:site-specific integrase [Klebsiella pneumoniae]ELA0883448.1 site-specific integrase [Klebsiella variicola]HDZ9768072.1 site-specific integrase [Klebsiella variicola subsp. variicola]ELA1955223.1 site-specific integrase [Klebsiella variicola]URL42266.1 site-specific integrase [Klebsiella pneumoniae]HBR3944621.1 site-specific integrase [Klebsiella pneumoniae]
MLNPCTYLYQRNGVYYFRLRVRQSNNDRMTSVSLRTKDRRTAMAHSRHIKAALKVIHADNPTASYEDMRGHLRDIAEWELSTGRSDLFESDMRDIYRDQYGELGENLTDALASEPLSIDQHRYINEALKVLTACMRRIEAGDSQSLIDYVDRFDGIDRQDDQASVSLSVSAPEVKPVVAPSADTTSSVTVASLFEQYEAENAQNWKPATLRENQSSHAALIEIFDYLGLNADANTITRADVLRVRDVLQQLPKNRKQRFKDAPLVDLLGREEKTDCLDVVTINNKYLIKMAAVFKWAVRNDLIKKNMTEGLELKVPQRKASEARNAFSTEQVGQLLVAAKSYSQKTSGKPYHYYVTALAAITGARLNEVAQLQVKDVRVTEAGTVYIHINEDDSSLPGKSIKNAHSDRRVPLVDGAYGFVLADFMDLLEARRKAVGDNAMVFDGLRLMKNGYGEQVSKWFNRTLLPKVLADRDGLAFHSFRHTVATQLKQHGVELAYAQAIMGHSSGSITYDRYAKEVEVDRLVNVLADVYKEIGVNG